MIKNKHKTIILITLSFITIFLTRCWTRNESNLNEIDNHQVSIKHFGDKFLLKNNSRLNLNLECLVKKNTIYLPTINTMNYINKIGWIYSDFNSPFMFNDTIVLKPNEEVEVGYFYEGNMNKIDTMYFELFDCNNITRNKFYKMGLAFNTKTNRFEQIQYNPSIIVKKIMENGINENILSRYKIGK